MPDGEILTMFVGQCGVQMGNAIWELYCMEHGIRPDGHIVGDYNNRFFRYPNLCPLRQDENEVFFRCPVNGDMSNNMNSNSGESQDSRSAHYLSGNNSAAEAQQQSSALKDMYSVPDPLIAFFQVTERGLHVPRTVILDSEPSVIDEIRLGVYRNLFAPESLINGMEDAANNYTRGYYSVSSTMLNKTMSAVRKEIEKTDNLQAIMLYHSYAGGTGSGLGCRLLDVVDGEFPKLTKLNLSNFPGVEMSTSVVEPYNAVLCAGAADQFVDFSILFDNQSLVKMCTDHLRIERPTYTQLNRLAAQVSSGLTASMRFEGPLAASLTQLQTNLVPFQQLHYVSASLAPISTVEGLSHESIMVHELCNSVFDLENQLLPYEIENEYFMACALLCRGDMSVRDLRNSVIHLKKKGVIKLVDWCPTGFKIGLCEQPPACIPASGMAPTTRSVVGIYNSTVIMQPMELVMSKLEMLKKKRAFLHWYIQEGLEEQELQDASNNVKMICEDYMKIKRRVECHTDDKLDGEKSLQDEAVSENNSEKQSRKSYRSNKDESPSSRHSQPEVLLLDNNLTADDKMYEENED